MRRNERVSYFSVHFHSTVRAVFYPEGKLEAGGTVEISRNFWRLKAFSVKQIACFVLQVVVPYLPALEIVVSQHRAHDALPVVWDEISDLVLHAAQSPKLRLRISKVPSSCPRVNLPVRGSEVARTPGKQGRLPDCMERLTLVNLNNK